MKGKTIVWIGIYTATGIGLYFLLKKTKIGLGLFNPPLTEMQETMWAVYTSTFPSVSQYKDTYLKTEAFTDVAFLSAWYNAHKKGQDAFKYKNKYWETKSGMSVGWRDNQDVLKMYNSK
jgi:hypothetical protein